MMIFNKNASLFICFLFLCSCGGSIGAGTLGGWDTISFAVKERKLDSAINNIYEAYPEFQVPSKWLYAKEFWKNSGYDFLQAHFFYFRESPEEMYYVSYIGAGSDNPTPARIAIRSVYTEAMGWRTNDKFSKEENTRITKRFNDEIISKLEKYTNTQSKVEE
jgi:hypothetical protein